jgi:RNA polymerase sigma-70 factor (ECF subfamily)
MPRRSKDGTMKTATAAQPPARLDQITTIWSTLNDPTQFVIRYAPAIRRYLSAVLRDANEAEEAIQDFLVRVMEHGFAGADPGRGRFRDYLRTAVRNAALTHLRKKASERRLQAASPPSGAEEAAPGDAAEREWLAEWRQCLLTRAWRAVERHESRQKGNLSYTVLRLASQYPSETSTRLAARASEISGTPITADALRQKLSRARRMFSRALVAEVAETLRQPTPLDVEEELLHVGLMVYVRSYLPADWREHGMLPAQG